MSGIYARTKQHLPFVAAAAALAGVFLYLQIIRSVEPLALDQGLFACFGRWVPRGWLPYRDIYDSKPPLFLYTWALAWSFGGSAASVWWFEAVWLAATMGLTFALAARLWNRWAGLGAAAFIFLGLWSPGFGDYWSRAQAEELMALPMIAAAWTAIAAIGRPRVAIWAGVLTGVVGLYKIPGMAVAGAWAASWLLALPIRDVARRIGWFAAGLAAPWLLAVGWFAAHGALGAFYEAVFVYHRHNAEFISPPWSWVLKEFALTMARELGPMLVAAAGGLWLLWRDDRERVKVLGPWIALTLAALVLQRQLGGYQYLVVVPGLALAAGYGVAALATGIVRGRMGERVAAAAAILIVLVLAGRSAAAWQRAYGRDASYLRGKMTRNQFLRSFEVGILSPAVEAQAAAYVRARTTPDEGILVWGLGPAIYALADRHPVTRFPFHKLLLTDAPLSRMIPGLAERRADFLRRLQDDPPAYILIGTRDQNPFEPDDSVTGMMKFPEFEAYVRAGYREETRIGRFGVLRRAP